jgi:hypothetical protein
MMQLLILLACAGGTGAKQTDETSVPTVEVIALEAAAAIEAAQVEPPEPPTHVRTEHVLGAGTIYESPWYEDNGSELGRAIIVEGGIHGDEIAGTLAIDRLLPRIHILKGRVVWFPRMNKPAFDQEKRFINVDLNKVFPGTESHDQYEYLLAAEIFQWVGARKVDVVLTLHESRYLHDGSNPKTFGQTIVYGVKPMPLILGTVLDQLNQELNDPRHKFHSNFFPIATSSTEQFVDNFKIEGFCAETWRGFKLPVRVDLQEELILSFLDQMGIKYRLDPL